MALGFYYVTSNRRKHIVAKTAVIHNLVVLKHEKALLPSVSLPKCGEYQVMDMLPFFRSQPRTFVDSSRTIQLSV